MHDFYYTITPPQIENTRQEKSSACHLVCYKGVSMYVQPYDAEHYRIVSLCTTDPAKYLQTEFTPGSLIRLLL